MPNHESVLAVLSSANGIRDSTFLRASDEVIDEDPELAFGGGGEICDDRFKIVDATQKLHNNALSAEVISPDTFEKLSIVASLDIDATRLRGTGSLLRSGNRSRSGCASGRGNGHGLGELYRDSVDEVAAPERERPHTTAAVFELNEAVCVAHERSDESIRGDFNHHPWLNRHLGEDFGGALASKVSEHIV
jgi:hypothetical protein